MVSVIVVNDDVARVSVSMSLSIARNIKVSYSVHLTKIKKFNHAPKGAAIFDHAIRLQT